jgi:hypothetical protein
MLAAFITYIASRQAGQVAAPVSLVHVVKVVRMVRKMVRTVIAGGDDSALCVCGKVVGQLQVLISERM